MSTRDRIRQIIERWFLIEPLFFSVWTTHQLVIEPRIGTIRVRRGRIEYNPHFIETLKRRQLEAVLRCEALRILLKHPYQRRKENGKLTYMASNITLQEYLRTELPLPRARDVFGSDEFDQQYFEFYYYKLQELLDQEAAQAFGGSGDEGASEGEGEGASEGEGEGASGQAGEEGEGEEGEEGEKGEEGEGEEGEEGEKGEGEEGEEGGGEGATGLGGAMGRGGEEPPPQSWGGLRGGGRGATPKLPVEQYADSEASGTENTADWDVDELFFDRINERIRMAQESNAWGTVAGQLRERILATLKPKLDYRAVLRHFRASILSTNRTLTRIKPSRRYGFLYMGSRRDFTTRLLFAVDVSGSISSDDLVRGFSIINKFFKYGISSIDVIQFDTEIRGKPLKLKRARYEVVAEGRGGTSFAPVIEYIDQHYSYDGLIIFTDGYAPVPPKPKNRQTRILWLFNTQSNYERMRDAVRPIGRSIFLKEEEETG